MLRLAALLMVLLTACTSVGGEAVPQGTAPAPPTGTVTAQADVRFRPVEEVVAGGQAEPPDRLADDDGVVYRLGPAIGDMTRFEQVGVEEAEYGGWVVTIVLGAEDAQAFGQWTADNVGKQLAIVVDDVVVSAPTIQAAIPGGTVQITGPFTREEAEELADAIVGG